MLSSLTRDQKDEKRLAAKRKRNEMFHDRLLNERNRLFGIDREAIEKQIQEKKQREEVEKQRDSYFDDLMMNYAHAAENRKQQIQRERREILRSTDEYRKNNQQKIQRREWDLSDPDHLKKEKIIPAISFHGEDPGFKERKKKQQEQMKRWIEEKRAEEEKDLTQRLRDSYDLDRSTDLMNEYASGLEEEQRKLKREKTREVSEFNRSMSELKKSIDLQTKQQDNRASQSHVDACKSSPFLCEDYHTTIMDQERDSLCTNNRKYIKYHFKGFSQEIYKDIQDIRQRQIREKKQQDEDEKERERNQLEMEQRNLRLAKLYEREVERKRRENLRDVQETREQQSQINKRKKEFFDELYKGKIDPNFFDQFGKDCR